MIRGFFAPAGNGIQISKFTSRVASPRDLPSPDGLSFLPRWGRHFCGLRVGVTGFVTARYRSLGLARFLAEEIYRDRRSYKYCGDRRPAANRFAGKPEIV